MSVTEQDITNLSTYNNRFLSGFLVGAMPGIQIMHDMDQQIAQERYAWLRSKAVDQITEQAVIINDAYGVLSGIYKPNKGEAAFKTDLIARLYSPDPRVGNKAPQINNRHYPKVAIDKLNELFALIYERRDEFKGAIRPFLDQKAEVGKELAGDWVSFMGQDFLAFHDFNQFLEDDIYGSVRQFSRPFLEHLAQSPLPVVETASRSLIGFVLETVPDDLFQAFVDSQTTDPRKGAEGVFQWLALLSYPSTQIDAPSLAAKIRDSGVFPKDLKFNMSEFLNRTLSAQTLRTKQLLRTYTEPAPLNFIVEPGIPRKRKAGEATPEDQAQTLIEEEGKTTYQLMIIKRSVPVLLEGDLREKYIQDVAQGFNDEKTTEDDVRRIVDSLQDDPYGLGVGKLYWNTPSLDMQRQLVLRKYRADQRPNIPLSSEAKRLRAVFYFDERAFPNTIFLHKILHHSKFDDLYTS
jgi:hypothetical protein